MFISKKLYGLLFFLLGIVYFLGFLFPLMDLDATEYAMVAYRMVANHDYINIISRSYNTLQEYDFLDKPHLSFWLEALCYKIFGVKDWAYRIPSYLFTILGGISTFKLGKKLYNDEVGYMSSFIFLSAQAIILENHDARTDAILGGAVIFGIWQLFEFIQEKKGLNLFLGILGIAMGVATKGMIAVVVSGSILFFWFLYSREWIRLWDPKWLWGIPLFFLFLSPVLYAYYLQFDAHPEKLVKNAYHVSGIKFLLWSQSFERFAGEGEYIQYPEFSFFFHTYLWAFLPWSLISYYSVFYRAWDFIKLRFKKVPYKELLTLGGSVSLFLLLSGMQYKMPHYINILFPFFAILLGSFIIELANNKTKLLGILVYVQGFVAVILVILAILLNTYTFPLHSFLIWTFFFILILGGIYFFVKGENKVMKLILPSAFVIIAVNLLLNGNFYPSLLKFQAGNSLAAYIQEKKISKNEVYGDQTFSRSFDFYMQTTIPILSLDQIQELQNSGKRAYLYTEVKQMQELLDHSIPFHVEKMIGQFRVTQLNIQFLNPNTRINTLKNCYLLRIN